MRNERYTIELMCNVHGWDAKSVRIEVEAANAWAAVDLLGETLTKLVALQQQSGKADS